MAGSVRAVMAISALALVGATATSSVPGSGPCVTSIWTQSRVYWGLFLVVGDDFFRPLEGELATGDRVGEPVSQVRCSIGGRVHNPSYRPRDGDASHLPAGTPIYSLPSDPEHLVVHEGGHWQIYAPEDGN